MTQQAPSVTAYPVDPLGSPMWEAHARTLFEDHPVRFEPALKLSMPQIAEDQHRFPVALDARGLGEVKRMVIFADLNPIPLAADYRPLAAAPYLAIRIKLDQRTPVRGAAQLADGSWLVSGAWVDAAGGGCSAPPVSRVRGDWAQHLGEIHGGAWPGDAGATRLRFVIRHPMDTGFVANIPTYNIETLSISSADKVLGTMEIWAAMSEDPAFTLMPMAATGATLSIAAHDTNGRDYTASVTAPAS
ncbi:quinoprotein dehydrogenase-associated SoxYZ-like carrier [Novosphingobium rosa]|uniref:quinoprotein dehydrogenase-associated SoxYZ-like carrier n=1 Tax=Novosphingobium rosa TaxID=76978 RepID=UPI00082A6BD8|nr:quinoprotein dehydrogenase-associated SoxYZ-like carrier [Novosphingobium rosa]